MVENIELTKQKAEIEANKVSNLTDSSKGK